jgi:hypothetical protein
MREFIYNPRPLISFWFGNRKAKDLTVNRCTSLILSPTVQLVVSTTMQAKNHDNVIHDVQLRAQIDQDPGSVDLKLNIVAN